MQDWPWTFRVDLPEPDSSGMAKYVLAADDERTMCGPARRVATSTTQHGLCAKRILVCLR